MVSFVTFIILDGWGVAPNSPGNSISQAKTPNINSFLASFPHTTLSASGEAVGLPRGEVGNTETGHLNLGAGRIIYQDLLRINRSIADGSFFENKSLIEAISHAEKNNSNLHILGLIGGGVVHSSTDHLYALIRLCKEKNFTRLYLHLITDGRDSPPTSTYTYISQIEQTIKKEDVGKIATIMGRYWAMDRDLRWERTEKAYHALTLGEGRHLEDENLEKAIDESYDQGITDEFINPIILEKDGLIKENDSVIFFNFRIDRPRQLSRAFVFEDFKKEAEEDQEFDPYAIYHQKSHLISPQTTHVFDRGEKIKNLFFVTMTQYSRPIANYAQVAFSPAVVNLPLSGVIEAYEKRQLKIAESEKERFVTFYFNGQRDITYQGEDKKIIPSPKVDSYDKMPEMSAYKLTQEFLDTLKDSNPGNYVLITINFANADMVGHTGNMEATKKACEIIDECLKKIVGKTLELNGAVVITADHGNAEEMLSHTGRSNTEHSGNPVPFIIISKELANSDQVLTSGILADVAPTILKLLNIEKPGEMTGRSLI